jgi:RNA polymerase sigma factor for flagellar operon FliA
MTCLEPNVDGVKCYQHIEHHHDLTAFVQEHAALIHKMAWHLKHKLPESVELDDLIQSGLIGLLDAKNTYLKEAGAAFTTYASLKVRCAMYECVRKNSGITRDISQHIKKISAAISRIENNQDGQVSSQAIAAEMGVSAQQYADMTREINAYKSISMHDVEGVEDVACEKSLNPLEVLADESEKGLIKSMLSELPKREQIILALYYTHQLNFKEIGEVMNLTEARISQIHAGLLSKLKRKLTNQHETLI